MKPEDLKRFSLLAEFTEDDRDELMELIESVHFASQEVLFREGDQADALYLISEGRVAVSTREQGALGQLDAPVAIGAASLMVIGRRQAAVIAEREVEVAILTRESFRRLAEDAPRTACRLAEAIVADLVGALRPHLDDLA